MADTAGLRLATEDLIEKEGISRALNLYEKSDLVLLVIDVDKYQKWIHINRDKTFNDYLKQYLHSLNLSNLITEKNMERNTISKEYVIILNKTDLGFSDVEDSGLVKISCKTEDGIGNLVNCIGQKLKKL